MFVVKSFTFTVLVKWMHLMRREWLVATTALFRSLAILLVNDENQCDALRQNAVINI
jgi:hypothetical protein